MDPCAQWEEQISALLDGELPEAEAQALTEHLAACGACRAYWEDLNVFREAVVIPAPEGFTQLVMDRVAAASQTEQRRRMPASWRRWGLLAACCTLAALGLWKLQGAAPGGAVPAGAARGAFMEYGEAGEDQSQEVQAYCAADADQTAGDAGGTPAQAPLLQGAPQEKAAASSWESLPVRFRLSGEDGETELDILSGGGFTGQTGVGEAGTFTGRFSPPEALDGFTYLLKVQSITAGAAPWEAEEALYLYLPGTPVEELPEELLYLTGGGEGLPCGVLYSPERGLAFVEMEETE